MRPLPWTWLSIHHAVFPISATKHLLMNSPSGLSFFADLWEITIQLLGLYWTGALWHHHNIKIWSTAQWWLWLLRWKCCLSYLYLKHFYTNGCECSDLHGCGFLQNHIITKRNRGLIGCFLFFACSLCIHFCVHTELFFAITKWSWSGAPWACAGDELVRGIVCVWGCAQRVCIWQTLGCTVKDWQRHWGRRARTTQD